MFRWSSGSAMLLGNYSFPAQHKKDIQMARNVGRSLIGPLKSGTYNKHGRLHWYRVRANLCFVTRHIKYALPGDTTVFKAYLSCCVLWYVSCVCCREALTSHTWESNCGCKSVKKQDTQGSVVLLGYVAKLACVVWHSLPRQLGSIQGDMFHFSLLSPAISHECVFLEICQSRRPTLSAGFPCRLSKGRNEQRNSKNICSKGKKLFDWIHFLQKIFSHMFLSVLK